MKRETYSWRRTGWFRCDGSHIHIQYIHTTQYTGTMAWCVCYCWQNNHEIPAIVPFDMHQSGVPVSTEYGQLDNGTWPF